MNISFFKLWHEIKNKAFGTSTKNQRIRVFYTILHLITWYNAIERISQKILLFHAPCVQINFFHTNTNTTKKFLPRDWWKNCWNDVKYLETTRCKINYVSTFGETRQDKTYVMDMEGDRLYATHYCPSYAHAIHTTRSSTACGWWWFSGALDNTRSGFGQLAGMRPFK